MIVSSPWLNLPNLLRWLGAVVIVLAFYSYLIQEWDNTSTVLRHSILLGHTFGLAVLGLGVGQWFREPKGARLFIILSLGAVCVNFAVLGGPILSQWGDTPTTELTDLADGKPTAQMFWENPSASDQNSKSASTETNSETKPTYPMPLWLSLAFLVLTGVTWIGFKVLARAFANSLSMIFLLNNTLLWLPTRDGSHIATLLMIGALSIAMLCLQQKAIRCLKTGVLEHIIAFAMLALPLLILGGRSLMFYAHEDMLYAALSGIIYAALYSVAPLTDSKGFPRKLLGITAFACSITLLGLTSNILSALPLVSDGLGILLAATLCFIQCDVLSKRLGDPFHGYRLCASVLLGAAGCLALFLEGQSMSWAILLAGVMQLSLGGLRKQRTPTLIGSGLILLAISGLLKGLFGHFQVSNWLLFILLGVATIVVGSALERFGPAFKAHCAQLHSRFNTWGW